MSYTPPSNGRTPRRYALVNRPASFGALPANLRYEVAPRPPAGQPHHAAARHGILIPERPLSAEELAAFELVLLLDEPSHVDGLAAAIVDSMGRYAMGYLEAYDESPEIVEGYVLDKLSRFNVSVPDAGVLVALVLSRIKQANNADTATAA